MNLTNLKLQFKKYGLGLILVWTCILSAFLIFILNVYHKETIKEAVREATDYHDLNLYYRRWSASLGGVYVRSDKVEPNPHLTVPERDVKTESGTALTLVNPAYMTRMVFESIRKGSKNPVINRLVSLNPLNPVNAPNEWERETLKTFEIGPSRERHQLLTIEGRHYLQYMAAFITEESCLKCHAHQGYKVGDILGGISIAIPMSGYLAIEAERRNSLLGGIGLIWIMGSTGIAVFSRKQYEQDMIILDEKIRLEQEIIERQHIQEQLEEQAAMLEEEGAERQQAVSALQKTEHFLQAIIDTEPECVKLIDADCNLLLMNRAGLQMIEAESFERVQGENVCQLVNEPYRSAFEELTRKVFQGQQASLEFEITGLAGHSLWLNSMAVPFRDENGTIVAALAITRNVTELKLSLEALRRSEALFRTLSFNAPVGIFQTDLDGNCVYANNTWCRLTGLTSDDAMGTGWSKALHPDDRDRVFSEWNEAVRTSQIFNSEYRFRTPTGREHWVSCVASPLADAASGVSGYIGCISDITERKKTEDELQKRNAEIEQFIYTTSHDLRTPLVTVKTFLGFLENDLAAADQIKVTQDLQFIHNAADKMKLLLDELLELSRIDRVENKPERMSLCNLLDEVLGDMAGIISERKVSISLPETDITLYGDRQRMCQIWQNLIENSIKYCSEDSHPRVEIGVRQADGKTVFFVQDNGIGIAQQYHSKIFGVFEKLDPNSPGAGLGLSMVQRIIEKRGGRIWVESEGNDKGSCFCFTLPDATSDVRDDT